MMFATISAAQAVVAILMSPVARLIGVGVLALVIGFGSGWGLRDKLCDRAVLKAQIAAQQRDLAIEKSAREEDHATIDILEHRRRKAEERQRELEQDLAHRTDGGCPLSDADARWLRNQR